AVEGSFPLPRDRFLGEPGIGRTRLSTLTSTLSADYESGDSWSFSASLYWQKSDADGMKVEPAELEDIDLAGSSAVLLRELQDESQSTETFAAQAELAAVIEIGRAENRVLAGYEFSSVDERVKLRGSNSEEEPFEIDIFDVEYGRELPRLSPLRDSAEFVDVHSLYVQDFVKLGERWRLLAGTRLDILDLHGRDRVASTSFSQEDSKLSSRVGIVYSPIPAVSLFASFSEALEPNEGLTPGGEPLQPTRGRGYEGGFRFRYPALSLSLDASVFRIRQTNVATDAPDDPGFEIQTAGQVSRGLDLDLFLKPAAWVQLGVKYGYNDAGIADDPEIPDGTAPINAPLHKLIVSGGFSFSLRREEDLRAGIYAVYTSKRQASTDPEELSVKLPGYTTTNLFINYAFSPHLDLGIDVTNLFDEDYFSASQSNLLSIVPGPPLTVFSSVRIHF
ncbi:MAG: TonB-dependent receptor, partial [Gammaproteobacteria bacterium]|nr:TonB-dependent receptor [Gammaproteobacteria bacterium]